MATHTIQSGCKNIFCSVPCLDRHSPSRSCLLPSFAAAQKLIHCYSFKRNKNVRWYVDSWMLWAGCMLFGEASRLPHDCAWCFSFFITSMGEKLFTPFPHMSETTTMCYNYIALGDELGQVLIFHIIWPGKLVRDEDKDASHDKLTSRESQACNLHSAYLSKRL